MEHLHDLDAFAKIISDKGYNGYFTTQAAYPGKIKASISEYLENCKKGSEPIKREFMLMGYLQWSGEDKPRVECSLWVQHEKGNFDLLKMEIAKKDQFGQVVKHAALTNLSVVALPKIAEAIAMVNDAMKQNAVPVSRRFKM